MEIPKHLSHKPIVAVDYEKIDTDSGSGDTMFLSLGRATWDNDDFSAKALRKTWNTGRWSRQSEEIPFWRLLDLTTLFIALLNDKLEYVDGKVVASDEELQALKAFIVKNKYNYGSRIERLKNVLK